LETEESPPEKDSTLIVLNLLLHTIFDAWPFMIFVSLVLGNNYDILLGYDQ
jgi:hypothetical protein